MKSFFSNILHVSWGKMRWVQFVCNRQILIRSWFAKTEMREEETEEGKNSCREGKINLHDLSKENLRWRLGLSRSGSHMIACSAPILLCITSYWNMLRSDLQVSLFLPMSVMYLMGSGDCPTLVRKFASLIFSCPRHLARPHTLSAVSIVSYMGQDCITCYFHDVICGRIVVYFYSRSVSDSSLGKA